MPPRTSLILSLSKDARRLCNALNIALYLTAGAALPAAAALHTRRVAAW